MKIFYGYKDISIDGPTVVTIGTFDGLHIAHHQLLSTLTQLSAEKKAQSVVMTFSPHPRAFFAPQSPMRLLSPDDEKIRLLESEGIDILIIVPFDREFASMTAHEFYREVLTSRLNMCAMVVGYDHSFGSEKMSAYQFLSDIGTEVIRMDEIIHEGITVSSSAVRRAISGGDISLANTLLGRPYCFSGEVIHGKQLGRKLGFPTANIDIDHHTKLMPPDGVYAVNVYVDGKKYHGMMNCGMRPTLDDRLGRSVEIHIFDFEADIYGQTLRAEIMAWVRSERKFNSLDALVAQLKKDAHTCRSILEK